MESSPKKKNHRNSGVGGRRKGAGRPKGSVAVRTREVAKQAAKDGITPLEVMIKAMREAYNKGGAIAAFNLAKDCAPYMHARINSIDLKADVELSGNLAVQHVLEFGDPFDDFSDIPEG